MTEKQLRKNRMMMFINEMIVTVSNQKITDTSAADLFKNRMKNVHGLDNIGFNKLWNDFRNEYLTWSNEKEEDDITKEKSIKKITIEYE